MKRRIILPLALVLLLCGCSGGEEAAFDRFRQELAEAEEIIFTADVQAEYEDKTAEFTLCFSMQNDEYRVEILEPEIVKGISARVKSGETHLEYDGAILDIGKLTDRGLCPMSALPFLLDAMRDAHVDMTWTENGLLAVRLIPSDDMSVTLWLDEDNEPVNAEIEYEEKTVVFIEIHDWETETNEGSAEENMG
ncbi:MAG: hypothetical protein Q4A83_06850 [Bacillota bacterium]|nr:hypothetical protein [Bacillota bacterium]